MRSQIPIEREGFHRWRTRRTTISAGLRKSLSFSFSWIGCILTVEWPISTLLGGLDVAPIGFCSFDLSSGQFLGSMHPQTLGSIFTRMRQLRNVGNDANRADRRSISLDVAFFRERALDAKDLHRIPFGEASLSYPRAERPSRMAEKAELHVDGKSAGRFELAFVRGSFDPKSLRCKPLLSMIFRKEKERPWICNVENGSARSGAPRSSEHERVSSSRRRDARTFGSTSRSRRALQHLRHRRSSWRPSVTFRFTFLEGLTWSCAPEGKWSTERARRAMDRSFAP